MPRGGPRPNSGGDRPGAGRKPRPARDLADDVLADELRRRGWAVSRPDVTSLADLTPKAYAYAVLKDPTASEKRRDWACAQLMAYEHTKVGEAGKKETKQAAAEKVAATGAFIVGTPPPRLVASNQAAASAAPTGRADEHR